MRLQYVTLALLALAPVAPILAAVLIMWGGQ